VRVLTRAADDALFTKLQQGLPKVADGRRMAEAYLSLFDRLLEDLPITEPQTAAVPGGSARARLAGGRNANGALPHAPI
jgi:hypothetical protein